MYAIRSYYGFRRNIQIHREQFLTAAVIYLGDVKNPVQGSGLTHLAHSLYTNNHIKLVVDDAKQIDPSILRYSFLRITSYNVCYTKLLRIP